jgi:glutamate 5-kinase
MNHQSQISRAIRSHKQHDLLADWQTIVIKVGSALIAPDGNGCSSDNCLAIAHFIQQCHQAGKHVILVSSGSVAAGRNITNTQSNLSLPKKQAMAAIGQAKVINHWQRFFDRPCAQILLTRDDFNQNQRALNATNTLSQLLAMGALPVINENDTVAIEELCIGDNDNLAADVAVLVKADLLLMCSDIDGLYSKNPRQFDNAKLIDEVFKVTAKIHGIAGGAHHQYATGGMRTKIQAAEKATASGITTLIADGRQGKDLSQLLDGINIGTIFHPHKTLAQLTQTDVIGYQLQVSI